MSAYAFKLALIEYQKDHTIDLEKRKKEIFYELLFQFKKEKDLLVRANKLVDKYSNIDERYKDLASEEAYEKQRIRQEAEKILEKMRQEQKESKIRNMQPLPVNTDVKKIDDSKNKIEDIEVARRKVESLRRAALNRERVYYKDRQKKIAYLVKQLPFVTNTQNAPIQDNSISSVQRTLVQKSSVHCSNIKQQPIVKERVVVKEVEPISKKDDILVQALVPKKQKSSFMQYIQNLGIKVANKFSEATITAYEMLTFKNNRNMAIGKHSKKVISPLDASNAYEKNIKFNDGEPTIDVRSKPRNKSVSFLERLQAKADEKAAFDAMNSKSKNESTRSSKQRGA